jgi:probable F420-dependent oxidoreductase
LPGRVSDPRPGINQARAAERLGLGSVWVSERYDTKEIGSICGALSQVTDRIRITVGTTHFGTRNPVVIAALGVTMQALSNNRFVIGIGRSGPSRLRTFGLSPMTNQALADHASILRRLWAGETVNYHGPAGRLSGLRLEDLPAGFSPPRLILAATGPKTIELAARHFDGVVLHPFLTPEAVHRAASIVRRVARDAGRDDAAFAVTAIAITSPDLSLAEQEAVVRGRAVTYFISPILASLVARMNGWDMEPIRQLQADPRLPELLRLPAERVLPALADIGKVLPDEWLISGAAIGSPQRCAAALHDFLDAGADEVLLHATTPDRLGDVPDHF